jgi:hypothetical protein
MLCYLYGVGFVKRTAALAIYATIDAVADCSCPACRNYRRAWKRESFDASLLAACAEIGIDPAKSLEMSLDKFSRATNAASYHGQFPFFGTVNGQEARKDAFYPWFFSAEPFGSARVAEGLACIMFCVDVPWILE